LERQTGPAASTVFKGVSSPLSNRRGPPGPKTKTAATGVGARRSGNQTKASENLPLEYSAWQRRCAIARSVPLPTAAARRGSYRLSWAVLSRDERKLWLAILLVADGAGVLSSWAGGFLDRVRLAGDDELSDEDAFGLELLMRYAVGALGLVEARQ
jgi:hypothetical protein